MSIRKLTLPGLVVLGALLLTVTPASAANSGFEYHSSFNLPEPGFNEPYGIVVDQSTGDVHVEDRGQFQQSLSTFDAQGVFQSSFSIAGSGGSGPVTPLAGFGLDEATSRAYVAEGEDATPYDHEVWVFNSSGGVEGEWTGSNTPQKLFPSGQLMYVAVDNSTSPADPSAGDVYVVDTRVGEVEKFNTGGDYLGQVTGAETPQKGFPISTDGTQQSLDGLAVNASGDLYVLDSYIGVVDEFDPEGKYLRQLQVGPAENGLAVDRATGDVYLAGNGEVDWYDSSGNLLGQLAGTPTEPFELKGPTAVAIDEASGDLYVVHGQSYTGATPMGDVFGPVSLAAPPKTDPATAATTTSATLHGDVNPNGVATEAHFTYGHGGTCLGAKTPLVAVGSGSSDVLEQATVTGLEPNTQYLACFFSVFGQEASAGAPVSFTTESEVPTLEGVGADSTEPVTTVKAKINPNNQDTTCKVEYGESEAYGSSVPCEPADLGSVYSFEPANARLTGLSVGTTYHYRVVATNATGVETSADATFVSVARPAASTGATSNSGASSVDVTGTVNPNGLETYYFYQYGPTTEYGQSTPEAPGTNVGAGVAPVQAPAAMFPLTAGLTYHYRLVARNEEGTTYGADEAFATPADAQPLVTTGAPSGVSVDEATISGTVDPRGVLSSYRFEYGTTTGYGTQTFGTASPDQGPQTVSLSLRGIQPGTTYHYRLVASSEGGISYGEDATFTTPGIVDPLVNPVTTPLIAVPQVAFPKEEPGSGTTVKTLTKAQKLALALKACKKQHGKRKQAKCEKQARAKYGAAKKRPAKRKVKGEGK